MEFLFLAVLLALSSYFAAAETALTAINKMNVRLRAAGGDARSIQMLKIIEKPDRMITTVLILNNVVNILLPTIVTVIAIRHDWKVSVATTILTVVLILFAEVLPKTMAVTYAEPMSYSKPVLMPIYYLVKICTPVAAVVQGFTNIFVRILTRGQVTEAKMTKEEVRAVIDIAETSGAYDSIEGKRLREVLDFPDKDVEDVLGAHRTEIVALPITATFDDVRDVILTHGYTRYPVYDGDIDHIVGLFLSKKLVEWSIKPTRQLVEFLDTEPLFVVANVEVEKVFKRMTSAKKHLAIVLDEYGGTLGIVTTEDMIEDMIGQEIEDETDRDIPLIYEGSEHMLICSGRIEITRVNALLHVEIPLEHEIIGGLILEKMQRVPQPGDMFAAYGLTFTINNIEGTHVTKVTIVKGST